MAEGKAGPRSPGVPDGWESDSSPDDYRNYSSSGRGATTADAEKTEPDDPPIVAEDVPEFPPEGWGEAGENYPPTQGPLEEVYEPKDEDD
ncbi:MAG TPA: hypothetical protein VKI45_00710 [Allosphingosinicella sp.]|nr:hypothetical protein [Allosphingosinicella sp.]